MAENGIGHAVLRVLHAERGHGLAGHAERVGAIFGRARRRVPRNVWSDVLLYGTDRGRWRRARFRENVPVSADRNGEPGGCAADEPCGVHAELGSWTGDQEVSAVAHGPVLRAGSNVSVDFCSAFSRSMLILPVLRADCMCVSQIVFFGVYVFRVALDCLLRLFATAVQTLYLRHIFSFSPTVPTLHRQRRGTRGFVSIACSRAAAFCQSNILLRTAVLCAFGEIGYCLGA